MKLRSRVERLEQSARQDDSREKRPHTLIIKGAGEDGNWAMVEAFDIRGKWIPYGRIERTGEWEHATAEEAVEALLAPGLPAAKVYLFDPEHPE
jgi:hypothetical protein